MIIYFLSIVTDFTLPSTNCFNYFLSILILPIICGYGDCLISQVGWIGIMYVNPNNEYLHINGTTGPRIHQKQKVILKVGKWNYLHC